MLQVTGALAREIRSEVRTKGKLTARGNERKLRERATTSLEGGRERERKLPFFRFSARTIHLLSTYLLKRDGARGRRRRGEEEGEEGWTMEEDHREVGIRSSVTNDSWEKFAATSALPPPSHRPRSTALPSFPIGQKLAN